MLDGVADAIQIAVQFVPQFGAKFAARHRFFHPVFHPVCQFAQAHRAGHARAAFERMQVALQVAAKLRIARLFAPCAQGAADLRVQFVRFFQEDGQQLLVHLVVYAALGMGLPRCRRNFLRRCRGVFRHARRSGCNLQFRRRVFHRRAEIQFEPDLRHRRFRFGRGIRWCQRFPGRFRLRFFMRRQGKIQDDFGQQMRLGNSFHGSRGWFGLELQRLNCFRFRVPQLPSRQYPCLPAVGRSIPAAAAVPRDCSRTMRAHFVQLQHHLIDEQHLLFVHHLRFVNAHFQPQFQRIGQFGNLHEAHGAVNARQGMRRTHEVIGDDVGSGFVQHAKLFVQRLHMTCRLFGRDVEQAPGTS